MKPGIEIQGGAKKGHKIRTPKGIRPTRALIKRSLFDRLGNWIVGRKMLELYAGSGAVGLEALSRGAEFVVFVEKSREGMLIIRENAKKLGLGGKVKVIKKDALKALRELIERGEKFDFVFADPPYKFNKLLPLLDLVGKVLEDDGIFVLETHKRTVAPKSDGLELEKEVLIGDTKLWFYHRNLSGNF